MAEFINTVDVIGDDALIDSIICKSITEYRDDNIVSISNFIFYGCTALANINFPAVTNIGNEAFSRCTALTTADFTAASRINSSAFSSCTALSALILRNTSQVVTLVYSNVLSGTPIASGTGYIYVPRDLVDSYKSATNWSTYAAQFRALEDYTDDGTVTGKFVMPITWTDVSSWIAAGTYKDNLKIGDTVSIDLGDYGAHKMQVVAFDTDDRADGSGKVPITWIVKDIVTKQKMYSQWTESTYWEGSAVRPWLQNDFYAILPEDVKAAIVSVNKTYFDGVSKETKTSTDTLWIPSRHEVFGFGDESGGVTYYQIASSGVPSVFTNDNSTRIKTYNGIADMWWLRSATQYQNSFRAVQSDGADSGGTSAHGSQGIVFGFCT